MQFAELITILENSLVTLANARAVAVSVGDLQKVIEIDAKIGETETTLSMVRK